MKKGDVSMKVVLLILAVIGAVILFTGTKLWAETLKEEKFFDRETCRASVTWVSLSKTAGVPLLNLKCSSEFKETSTKEEFKKELVESIRDCWYMYGSGKIDFVSNLDIGPSDKNCFICSVLTPTDKVVISGEEIQPYLFEQLNFKYDKDIIVDPDNSLYVSYIVVPQVKLLEWKNLLTYPIFFYKSGARYSMLVGSKDNLNKVCDSIYPVEK